MIALAFAEELERQGFGTYGENIWWDTSPVLNTGSVSELEGVWVYATPVETGLRGCWYRSTITVSTRFTDMVRQGHMLMLISDFVNRIFSKYCQLRLTIGVDCVFPILSVGECSSGTLEAVDSEGRLVKTLSFDIQYRYPDPMPELQ